MEYRQLPKSDVWHFHPACRWWDRTSRRVGVKQKTTEGRPATGELCNECRAKSKRDAK